MSGDSRVTRGSDRAGEPGAGAVAVAVATVPPDSRAAASADDALFEIRRKIHPRAVTGFLARQRVLLVVLTQLTFYGTAWLEWNARQAVLFDLAARKFYIFGFVFWPQDFIFLTGLLAANFIGQKLVGWWEKLLARIPVVNSVYNSVKQVSDTIFSPNGNAFRKAVLINYPHQESWTIAFLTGQPGGYSVPGSGSMAFFDGGGAGDCEMDMAVNVAGIVLTK